MAEPRNVIIIGSGPAGLTAAVYTARANLAPLVIEGVEAGGQLMLTTEVENYPGFIDGIMGPELMERMRKQAARFGTEILTDNVTSVDLSPASRSRSPPAPRPSTTRSRDHLDRRLRQDARRSGREGTPRPRRVDLRDVRRVLLQGPGTARRRAAATPLWRRPSSSRSSLPRSRSFTGATRLRASKIMQDRALANPKIDFVWDSVITEIFGNGKVAGARLKNLKTGEESEIAAGGVFVAIGHTPNTQLFEGQLDLSGGYIVTEGEDDPDTRCRACSRPVTSSISATARRSPRPAWAAWPRSMPSATSRSLGHQPR